MEDGLRARERKRKIEQRHEVLILVLMEDGLREKMKILKLLVNVMS